MRAKSAQEVCFDPSLFCTTLSSNRFYVFSQREPGGLNQYGSSTGESGSGAGERDVNNEKLNNQVNKPGSLAGAKRCSLPTQAVLYTSKGEVHCELYPIQCPRTVENFVTHARQGYYNNLIFHRVIKGFMVQTGDPDGDGTGGDSIWGSEFGDEFHPSLRHNAPFTLAMANCGPNTNAS